MLRHVNFPLRGLLFLLLLAVACGGEKAQDFEVQLFDGRGFRLSDEYADNVVVINFWYPSCAPCREEMPEFQAAWEELEGEPVQFLGLFVPRGFDNESAAREFVGRTGTDLRFRHGLPGNHRLGLWNRILSNHLVHRSKGKNR